MPYQPYLPQSGQDGSEGAALKAFKLARRLIIASAVCCPASVVLPAGVFFSIGGVACAIAALVSLASSAKYSKALAADIRTARIIAIICLAIAAVTLVINVVMIVIGFQMLLKAFETGDFSAFGLDGNPFDPSTGANTGGDPQRSLTWG
ncbi:MAG: hypothetical protein FWD72_01530 [Eggerthellaceae bacterium]|nr:hypothetical protein [Eggerthellaceae bacterium]